MQSALVMMITGDSNLDRVVLRHEAGHFAGLMHTTEIDVGADALADTPQCSDVEQQLFNCPDFDNLMFPFANEFSPMQTSEGQETIVQASAIYRGAVEPGGGFAEPLDQAMAKWQSPPEREPTGSSLVSSELAAKVKHVALSATDTGWRAHASSPAIPSLLGAAWCGTTPSNGYDVLEALGAQPDELIAIGLDPSAPAHVRLRALAGAGRLTPSLDGLDTLERLAADRGLPRLVRIGALDGLSHAAPSRLHALALHADADPVVATVASRR